MRKGTRLRKVLFISYTTPPSGGAGAQSSAHFVKHLRKFGYEPIVLTVSEDAWPAIRCRPILIPCSQGIPSGLNGLSDGRGQPFGLLRMLKELDVLCKSIRRRMFTGWHRKVLQRRSRRAAPKGNRASP